MQCIQCIMHRMNYCCHWPVYKDIHDHPDQRLTSRAPLWSDMEPGDLISQWRESWETASMINSSLMTDPPPGFNLPWREWSLLNRFRTAQGHCRACRKTWRLMDDDRCQCGEVQTMLHIGRDMSIYQTRTDEDAVEWLTSFEARSHTTSSLYSVCNVGFHHG